nr:PREDICTED: serine/threonine-protein phosphatase 7 long form homolog [Daucus carota subsp. sativus]
MVYTRAYVFWIIGAILFPTSSRATVHPRYIQLLQKTDEIIDYAWGAGVLANLYRELGKAVKKTSTSINGCVMLLQLWAYERLLPGRPVIARGLERVWPRARAWAEPVQGRRVNPHHHPYAHFYQLDDVDQEEDVDLYVACHMALGRIPMFAFEIVEYQMPDRVLRQFGILQHIPERPVDMRFLRAERNSASQRDDHIARLSAYRDEWDSFVSTGMPIITEGAYVPISEYMHWFRLHSKLRIVPCLAPPLDIIQPRDWFSQQSMVDAQYLPDMSVNDIYS